MKPTVRKAVFPAAGLGTRFLPATKAQPKEMLPLVDKPIIQYGIEEATSAGVEDIVIVTGRGKNAIEDHFDVSIELETFLEARGKKEQAAEVRAISNLAKNLAYVRQGEPLGLGHAVLTARPLVGNEPFAVILADDVIDAEPSALAQMVEVFDEVDGPVILVERVPKAQISGYGVIAAEQIRPGLYQVTDLVEKPSRRGCAVGPGHHRPLHPDARHLRLLVEEAASVKTGEIQLTNGLRRLLAKRPIYACEVTGVRHDTGNKLGFLKAVVHFALQAARSGRAVPRVPRQRAVRPELLRIWLGQSAGLRPAMASASTSSSRPCRTSRAWSPTMAPLWMPSTDGLAEPALRRLWRSR